MDKRESATVENQLERLAAFEPSAFPVISLYLDTRPDQRGRDNFQPFVRKELPARARTWPLRSPERESFERDAARIGEYLRDDVAAAANSLAIFACSGEDDYFEAVQLAAPVDGNALHIGPQPHLYPLARLNDQYRRYAVLVADTNRARLFVFGAGRTLGHAEVSGVKTNRTQMGGWSQARYQRHIDNYHIQHAKEIAGALERTVQREGIEHVLLAGDQVILPKLRGELSEAVGRLVVDELSLAIDTPEHEVLAASMEAMREQDARTDQEKVARLLDEYRAGALGVAGARDTLMALAQGQVDELLISARPEQIENDLEPGDASLLAPGSPVSDPAAGVPQELSLADTLIMRARQTGAGVTFVEDPALLAAVGGAGALLRYRT